MNYENNAFSLKIFYIKLLTAHFNLSSELVNVRVHKQLAVLIKIMLDQN